MYFCDIFMSNNVTVKFAKLMDRKLQDKKCHPCSSYLIEQEVQLSITLISSQFSYLLIYNKFIHGGYFR